MIRRKKFVSLKGLKYRVKRELELSKIVDFVSISNQANYENATQNQTGNESDPLTINILDDIALSPRTSYELYGNILQNLNFSNKELQQNDIRFDTNSDVTSNQPDLSQVDNEIIRECNEEPEPHHDSETGKTNDVIPSSNNILNHLDFVKVNTDFHVVRCVWEFLQKFTVEYNVQRSAITVLLHFFNHFFPQLPLDSRTLLGTPKVLDVINMSPGKYIHMGLENHLIEIVRKSGSVPNTLKISINVDGVPIHRDSKENNFWLILGKLKNIKSEVFPIGLYRGAHKPDNFNDLLEGFVREYKKLRNEFVIDRKKVNVEIENFPMDAPARCSVLCTAFYNSENGCFKCEIRGKFGCNRNTYVGCVGQKRTNESFRAKSDTEYHHGYSILEEIEDLDIIKCFLIDYLHVVLLGVMKKLCKLWYGEKGLFRNHANSVDLKLLALNEWKPVEFMRNFRSIKEIGRYKGTELRTLLLFAGPIVFKNEIPSKLYIHFMKLHIAIRILTEADLISKYIHVADALLKDFVLDFGTMYGDHLCSHNVHVLLHLCEDVKENGPLDQFSSFPFENFMSPIKEYVHGNNYSIEQMAKRIEESLNASHIDTVKNVQADKNFKVMWKKEGIEIYFKNYKFDCSQRNRYLLTKNREICVICDIMCVNSKILIKAKTLKQQKRAYYLPYASENLDIYECQHSYSHEIIIELCNIKYKMFAIPSFTNDNKMFFFPIRETSQDN